MAFYCTENTALTLKNLIGSLPFRYIACEGCRFMAKAIKIAYLCSRFTTRYPSRPIEIFIPPT